MKERILLVWGEIYHLFGMKSIKITMQRQNSNFCSNIQLSSAVLIRVPLEILLGNQCCSFPNQVSMIQSGHEANDSE